MDWIMSRLKEPSTWAGIASLMVALKVMPNTPEMVQTVTTIGTALAGVLAVVMAEHKSDS